MPTNNAVITVSAEDRTRTAFRKIQRNLKQLRDTAQQTSTVIAGMVGIGGLGLVSQNMLASADAIGKTADNVGLTTDALQELRYAGEISGISVQNLDKGFATFSKSLGELHSDTGALYTLLNKGDSTLKQQLLSAKNNTEAFEIFVRDQANLVVWLRKVLPLYVSYISRKIISKMLYLQLQMKLVFY